MNTSLSVSFSNPSPRRLRVVVEQDEWGKKGQVSTLSTVLHLGYIIFGAGGQPTLDCGVDGDGNYLSGVSIYVADESVVFDYGITRGVIGATTVGVVVKEESVSFSLDTAVTTKYPVLEGVSFKWSVTPWNAKAEEVPGAVLDFIGDEVKSSQPVYGTAIIKYKTVQHYIKITVDPRTEAEENRYQSVFWCRWDGGVILTDLKPPPNAEEAFDQETTCWGASVSITGPDPPYVPPHAPDGDRNISSDYCSGKPIVSQFD